MEEALLEKFEAKIEEENELLLTNKLNKSTVLRDMINKYINK